MDAINAKPHIQTIHIYCYLLDEAFDYSPLLGGSQLLPSRIEAFHGINYLPFGECDTGIILGSKLLCCEVCLGDHFR